MKPDNEVRTAEIKPLLPGFLAGLAGLMAFLVLHALWIAPIWFILPIGLIIAGAGGLAVGWSYGELYKRLPGRPWNTLVMVVLIAATLLPPMLLAELRRPMFTVTPAGVVNLAMGIPEIVLRFIFELLLPATLTGGVAGWWLGRTRRAAAATALAGLVFALGPGHNIPFIGGTHGVGMQAAMIGVVISISAFVLVEGSTRLRGQYARLKKIPE
jgi:hypothetical protein